MTKKLLLGNEAIAWGAVEAGVQVACAYPGTPSSEVLGTLAGLAGRYGFYAEWSVNEKAALEVAAGAAICGARALAAMKQVGLNVAADPLLSLAYIGVKGGLVLVVADDPGPHSSQTEQDTRRFAQFAKLPVLEPSTPAEAKEMVKYAFVLSEELSLPVILRPTTRTCHARQDVEVDEKPRRPERQVHFEKDLKWVIMPSLSAQKHVWLNNQLKACQRIFEQSPFNTFYPGEEGKAGVIACGVSYNYAGEALEMLGRKVPLLKVGTPYPLPEGPVLRLLSTASRVLVVEEQEPVVEEQVSLLAFRRGCRTVISGKADGLVPREGELNVDKVRTVLEQFLGLEPSSCGGQEERKHPELPARPPVLCAGCPHRASFYAFKRVARGMDAVFTGDIGCYTLGVMPPLNALDTCLCMGAGITMAAGMHRAEPGRRYVAFIGDSTFFHAGITGLINAAYNGTHITVAVLDNGTTAMTGSQPHPGVGRTATGTAAKPLDIAGIIRACGVEKVLEADPYNLKEAIKAAREALMHDGISTVIFRGGCPTPAGTREQFGVNIDKCTGCGLCAKDFGCPAITWGGGKAHITPSCAGCGVCAQICPAGAIEKAGEKA